MRFRPLFVGLIALSGASAAAADPSYYRLELDIVIDRPAAETWARIGGYCDISAWLGRECEITQGDGGVGTVRVLGGTIIERTVAQTELAYGYTQPVVEGQYYTLYHGFMEARPLDATSCRVIYTMMWDTSQSSAEQMQADIERRRSIFTAALAKMKEIAEAD